MAGGASLKLRQQSFFLRYRRLPVSCLSSAPVHGTRGSSAALLAKDSAIRGAPPVATNTGLGFRLFSPIIKIFKCQILVQNHINAPGTS